MIDLIFLMFSKFGKNKDYLYSEFEKEVVPHANALYNFALRLVNDPDEASDLVQETMLKAYRFFDKYEKGTNIKAWLYRILKNTFINEYRKKNKRTRQSRL